MVADQIGEFVQLLLDGHDDGQGPFLDDDHEDDHENHQAQDDEPHFKTFIEGKAQADEDHEGHGKNHVDAFGEDGLDFFDVSRGPHEQGTRAVFRKIGQGKVLQGLYQLLAHAEADAGGDMRTKVYGTQGAHEGYQRRGHHGDAEAADGVDIALQDAFVDDAGR